MDGIARVRPGLVLPPVVAPRTPGDGHCDCDSKSPAEIYLAAHVTSFELPCYRHTLARADAIALSGVLPILDD